MHHTTNIVSEGVRSSLTRRGCIIFIGTKVITKQVQIAAKLNHIPKSKIKRKKTNKFHRAENPLK
jgi:hypothetical protein